MILDTITFNIYVKETDEKVLDELAERINNSGIHGDLKRHLANLLQDVFPDLIYNVDFKINEEA